MKPECRLEPGSLGLNRIRVAEASVSVCAVGGQVKKAWRESMLTLCVMHVCMYVRVQERVHAYLYMCTKQLWRDTPDSGHSGDSAAGRGAGEGRRPFHGTHFPTI